MSTLATPRVQIIDPDVEFRETLAAYLRSCGYWVETCGNLDEGLGQAAHADFDLILLENALPETVGLTVLPTLQACQSNPCILLMSQDPGTALVRTALKEGAFDFLIKPLELAQIEKSMAAGLENRKAFLEIYHLSRNLQEANQQLQETNQQLSEQKHLLETERDHLKEWARELNVLNEFSSAICSTLDTREIIALVNSELAKLIRYDLCTLTLFQEPQVHIHFHVTLPIMHRLVEKIVADFVTASPRLLGQQVSMDEVMYEVAGRMGFGEHLYDTNFFLMSPMQVTAHLMVARERLGLIELYRFANEPFTAAQTRMLSTLANQVALALRNAYAYRKTQELTLRDGLTGLYNHAAFQDFLEREFEAFRRYNRALSLLMADIDHFKAINDTYGHQTGDFILQELAALGLASVRKSDLLARYGGEEFALILPDTDLAQAQILAGRLWQKVQDHRFIHHEEVIPIAISLGVASTRTLEVTRKEDLIRAADAALYRAKETGRNRYVLAYGNQVFRCPQDDEPLQPDTAFSRH
jgi:diguanylate cyclase (GGDEF)-like protein